MLTDQEIAVHSTTFNWRFEINIKKFETLKSEEFVKDLQKQIAIYTFIIVIVIMLSKNELKLFNLFKNCLYLKNVFDNDLAEILWK